MEPQDQLLEALNLPEPPSGTKSRVARVSPPGITEPSRYLPRGGAAPQPTSHWTPPALKKLGLGKSPDEQAPGAWRSGKGRQAGWREPTEQLMFPLYRYGI